MAVSGMLLTLRHTFRGPASIPSFDTYNTFLNIGGPLRITKDWKDERPERPYIPDRAVRGPKYQVDTLPQPWSVILAQVAERRWRASPARSRLAQA